MEKHLPIISMLHYSTWQSFIYALLAHTTLIDRKYDLRVVPNWEVGNIVANCSGKFLNLFSSFHTLAKKHIVVTLFYGPFCFKSILGITHIFYFSVLEYHFTNYYQWLHKGHKVHGAYLGSGRAQSKLRLHYDLMTTCLINFIF